MKVRNLVLIVVLAVLIGAYINRTRLVMDLKNVRLGKNFTLDEFVTTATGYDNVPGPETVNNLKALVQNVLQPLRNYLARPIRISSGYRSPQVNSFIGGSKTSQHLTGQAADISVEGVTNIEIMRAIVSQGLPFDQLIDEEVKGLHWVHVSFKPIQARREILAARFDDVLGKTVYKALDYRAFA